MPRRVPPLSAKALAVIQPGTKTTELVDGHVPGLRVRILPSGTRTWSLNIRDSKGVRRRFDLGSGLGLAQARRKAEDVRRAVRDGSDPTTERRAARRRAQAARDGDGTLGALLETYFTKGPGGQRRRAARNKRLLETVFRKVLGGPMMDIPGPELQLLADSWQSATTASLAVRLLRPCLKWAEKRGLVQPGTAALEAPATARKRERVLTKDEIRSVWQELSGTHGEVIKWLLWTGCRLNEAAAMTWNEINGDCWVIPSARAKNGRARVVPLPRQAIELLSNRGSKSELQGFVFPSKRGGVLSNWDRQTKRLHSLSGTTRWHRHDLRRTVATMLGDLGFEPHVISVVLGHAHIAEGATAIYARSRYQREHREALQALANEIDGLGTIKNNIVSFAAR
jgi:integrase